MTDIKTPVNLAEEYASQYFDKEKAKAYDEALEGEFTHIPENVYNQIKSSQDD